MSRLKIKKVEKAWGYEEWIVNIDLYCGKKIYSDGRKWSSNKNFHYHPIKDETFYVLDGCLQLDIAIEFNGWASTSILHPGQTFRIKPTIKHRFRGYNGGCTFFEFSTQHFEEDSIRCYYDKEKKIWVNIDQKS